MSYLYLVASLAIILLGAEVFTNGVEWFGRKLNLSDGTTGSILAAVGTALPETMIPIIAIVFGSKSQGQDIGVGAIIGAPFMLSTLAFFIVAVTTYINRKNRPDFPKLRVDVSVMMRDQKFFLIVFSMAVLSSFFANHILKLFIAVGLVLAYAAYAFQTITAVEEGECESASEIAPCHFARKSENPHLAIVIFQVACALLLIVWGADIFVQNIEVISTNLGIPAFVMALILAPIATELPEKFNSIIWITRGKDTLALGNITGAMVFQSSIIPAIGILLTQWTLNQQAYVSALLALLSSAIVYVSIRHNKSLSIYPLFFGGLIYMVFIAYIMIVNI